MNIWIKCYLHHMNRTSFIKSFISLLGLGAIPVGIIRHYKKVYLLKSFVRGFKYYDGPGLLNEMKEGDMVELRREPNNAFDVDAIALYFNNFKIGFIPAESNTILSKLMDAEVVELLGEIKHLQIDASTWENVAIAVYVLKESERMENTETQENITQLETNTDLTIKHPDDNISRIKWSDVEDETITRAQQSLQQKNI